MQKNKESGKVRERNASGVLRLSGERKWFCAIGYWLYPVGLSACLPDLRGAPKRLRTRAQQDPKDGRPPKEHTRAEAEARALELKTRFKKLSEAEAQLYNAQPVWHLRDLSIARASDVREVVREFLQMIDETSSEYFWPLRDPGIEIHWRTHGWKHISYAAMVRYWSDFKLGFEPAIVRAEGLGDEDEIRKLFSAAAGGDPEALGIVWSQFPRAEDRQEIVEWFFRDDERPKGLPHPAEFAADLVSSIFTERGTHQAELAQKRLLKLISASVARGSRTKKGRPKTRVPKATLRLLLKMGYCLAKQVSEVDGLVAGIRELQKDHHDILTEAYPWIRKVASDAPDFQSYETSKASMKIVAYLTGISTSFLEKMGVRSSR